MVGRRFAWVRLRLGVASFEGVSLLNLMSCSEFASRCVCDGRVASAPSALTVDHLAAHSGPFSAYVLGIPFQASVSRVCTVNVSSLVLPRPLALGLRARDAFTVFSAQVGRAAQ